MSYKSIMLSVIGIAILLSTSGCASRYQFENNGLDPVKIRTGDHKSTMILNQNGSGSLSSKSGIEIGNATISVGRRVKIINNGSDVIEVKYSDVKGSEQTFRLGENGIGHLSKTTPFQLNGLTVIVD